MREVCVDCEAKTEKLKKLTRAKESADARVEELEISLLALKSRLVEVRRKAKVLADEVIAETAEFVEDASAPLLLQMQAHLRMALSSYSFTPTYEQLSALLQSVLMDEPTPIEESMAGGRSASYSDALRNAK